MNSKTLRKLLQLDEDLKNEYHTTLEHYLGIYVRREEGMKYDCTPDDAKVFAFTGSDGDHFAFSTQNGTIVDLDEAPILFVQPMMFDHPVKAVARNINDLFSVYLSLKEFYILERFDWYQSEKDMILDIKQHYEKRIQERSQELDFISDKLMSCLSIKPMDDVYNYIISLRA